MPHVQDVSSYVRERQLELIQQYEEELHRHQEDVERLEQFRTRADERISETLEAAGFDLEKLHALERDGIQASESWVSDSRQALLERPSQDDKGAQLSQLYHEVQHPKGVAVPVYAATLLAPDAAALEEIAGERGNPWVFPDDPSLIPAIAKSEGTGTGCAGQGLPFPTVVQMFFTFVPDTTGLWLLWGIFEIHGNYVVVSNDTFWTCKGANIEASATLGAWQDFWRWGNDIQIIRPLGADNIQADGRIDQSKFVELVTPLEAGVRTVAVVTVELRAFATGGGSLAELNFSSGSGGGVLHQAHRSHRLHLIPGR